MRLAPASRTVRFDDQMERRELYFFTLYRCLQAALAALLVFSPVGPELATVVAPAVASWTCAVYLPLSALLLLLARRTELPIAPQVVAGLVLDIVATMALRFALDGIDLGLALLLIVNVGAGALLLAFRWGFLFAALASAATAVQHLVGLLWQLPQEPASETVMLALTYLAVAALSNHLGRNLRESARLAAERSTEAASLSQINDLIIRRLRSGVIVVDAGHRIRLANETAWHLLGEPDPAERRLECICPALSRRITAWRIDPGLEPQPLQLHPDRPTVVPRLVRLGTREDLVVVFLDDSELVSRRAEQLTLVTLGRLSASIAHEIRNPLSAIHHAAQLLEESSHLPAEDRKLLAIVLTQAQRVNAIVNNVLALSRREASRPEVLEISEWLQRFAEDYCREHFLDAGTLQVACPDGPLTGVFDPAQLHQVLGALVSNALRHGRPSDGPARIELVARLGSDRATPCIEVRDHGPGIPAEVAERIFEPFFTTSELGSGLGLYIARQICEANQAVLALIRPAEGGSCFRISLSRPLPIH